MKKMLSFLLLVVFLSTLVPVARATGEEDFYIDRDAIFSNMDRSYAQGYTPTIAWGRMMLAMPIRSDRAVGSITAELIISNDIFPFRIPTPLPRVQPVEPGLWAVSFNYTLLTNYKSGDLPCIVRITGKDAEGETLTSDIPTVIHIRDGSANTETRLIQVSDNGTLLELGQNGTVSVTLSNPGRSVGFEDLSLTVSDPDGEIFPGLIPPRSAVRAGRLPSPHHSTWGLPAGRRKWFG